MSEDEAASAGDPGRGEVESETPASDASEDAPDLAERVAEYDEELGNAVATLEADLEAEQADREDLEARVLELEESLEERTDQLQRTKADFQNFKKRTERKREELKRRATEDLVERLLEVRDNLSRAVDAEGDIREGVEATLRAFDDVLDEEGVEAIEPEPGDAVDPHRHEVMLNVESDQPTGTIAEVYRPGYAMGEKVLRPAQVTVSEAGEADTS